MTVLDDEARDLFAGPNIAHIARCCLTAGRIRFP